MTRGGQFSDAARGVKIQVPLTPLVRSKKLGRWTRSPEREATLRPQRAQTFEDPLVALSASLD
jgi:hypothetical protein